MPEFLSCGILDGYNGYLRDFVVFYGDLYPVR